MQVDFDPTIISYEEILELFWRFHDPTGRSWFRQYMNAVFYADDEQRRLAEESKARIAARLKGRVSTEIVPMREFYLAEGYHQKYYLRRHSDYIKEFRAMYPDKLGLVNSTAAARVNGFLAGFGRFADLEREAAGYGLSHRLTEMLLDTVYEREKHEKRAEAGRCPV